MNYDFSSVLSKNLLKEVITYLEREDMLILIGMLNKKIVSASIEKYDELKLLEIKGFTDFKKIENTADGYPLSIFYCKIKDRNIVVAGFSDRSVKAFDIDTGILIVSFTDHTDWINTVENLTSDDDILRIASGSYDSTVKIFEANIENHSENLFINKCVKCISHTNSIYFLKKITFSDQNTLLAVCSFQKVEFFDLATFEKSNTSGIIHGNYIYCLANLSDFLTDSYATCSYDKLIKVNQYTPSTRSHKTVLELKKHENAVWFLRYNPTYLKHILVSGGWDMKAIIWDLCLGTAVHVIEGFHTSSIWSLIWFDHKNLQQHFVLTGGTEGNSVLVNVKNGQVVKTFNFNGTNAAYYYDYYESKGKYYLLVGNLGKSVSIHKMILD